jgi:hypothetical protein
MYSIMRQEDEQIHPEDRSAELLGEVAGFVADLAGPEAGFITGASLPAEVGYAAK